MALKMILGSRTGFVCEVNGDQVDRLDRFSHEMSACFQKYANAVLENDRRPSGKCEFMYTDKGIDIARDFHLAMVALMRVTSDLEERLEPGPTLEKVGEDERAGITWYKVTTA